MTSGRGVPKVKQCEICHQKCFQKFRDFTALFEKNNDLAIIPCYNDTEITLRKLIQNELKDFKNLNSNITNTYLLAFHVLISIVSPHLSVVIVYYFGRWWDHVFVWFWCHLIFYSLLF